MSQKERVYKLLLHFCNQKGSRTFTLIELNKKYQYYENIGIKGKTPQSTVRRLLQELRDDQLLSFLDLRGAYTLLGIDLLQDEVESKDVAQMALKISKPEKKEYFIETYARNRGWVKEAKSVLGLDCLYPKCLNSFIKKDGTRYIEVHHIVPLYRGGEDGLWNLSVVCAHHHKMAHFATLEVRQEIEDLLLEETKQRI